MEKCITPIKSGRGVSRRDGDRIDLLPPVAGG